MKISLIKSVVIFTISAFSLLNAQSMLSYQYPTGIPLISSGGQSLSLGRTGVGIQNDFLSMSKNPANLGSLRASVFSSVISYDFLNISSSDSRSVQGHFSPQLLSFAFPLKNSLGAIAFSLEQKSNADLFFHTDNRYTVNNSIYDVKLGTKRTGGISCWQLGYGYSFRKTAQIGLTYERAYFNQKSNNYKQIAGALKATQNDSIDFHVAQNGVRGGIMMPYKKATIGLTGEYFFISEATKERFINTSNQDISPVKADFKLAPSLSVGASYQFTQELLAAADLGITLWNEFYSGFGTDIPLDNAINVSAGCQYIPAPNLLAPKYYQIIQYKAGLRFAQMPKSTAYECAANLGLGLPLQLKTCIIDLNFEYGRRYDRDYDHYYEEFFSLQFGINGSRKWYQTSGTSSY